MTSDKLSLKKIMKSISKGSENTKDIISFIIIMNNIEEERITVAGNDQLKPIS